jgi:drug/metabolite transporter (DMT)-like permease
MATIVCWTIAYVFTRAALAYVSVFTLGFLRYLVAAIALTIVGIALRIRLPMKRDAIWLLTSGLSGFTLYIIVFNLGASMATAATSSVVIATTPVTTALLARIIYNEQISRVQYIAIAVEFVGVILLAVIGGPFSANAGIAWLTLGAFLLSSYNLLQRKLTRTYSALSATMYSIVIGACFLCVFAPGAAREASAGLPGVVIFYIAALGLLSSAAAYISWAKAISIAPKTSYVSNYMFLTPFLTALLGFAVLGEKPDGATIVGGAVILAGMILYNLGKDNNPNAR